MQYIQATWINTSTGSHNAIVPTKETLDTIVNQLEQPMIGATASASGVSGMVPVPSAGVSNRYLCSDGTWKIPYTLPAATASVLGGVKIGSNITVSSGTISITKDNVTAALGYTPPTSNTDVNVTQNAVITTNQNYPILLGGTSTLAALTSSVNKAETLYFNPSTFVLYSPTIELSNKIYPRTSGSGTIGDTSNRFNVGYFNTVNTATGIVPDAAGGAYLGTSSLYFSSVYATNVYNRSGTTNYRIPVTFYGTTVPSSSLGSNGDIYIQYVN